MSKKKKQTTKPNVQPKGKEPKFIIEKDGKAYFKDKPISLVCRPSIKGASSKYPGYLYEFDYQKKLDWFKNFVLLMTVNGGAIRYVGMTEEEFMALGGKKVEVDGYSTMEASKIKGKRNLFK